MECAAARVFGIEELLVQIIFSIQSPREILVAQRVCKAWKDTIKQSPDIARRLFRRMPDQPLQPSSILDDGHLILYDQDIWINQLWLPHDSAAYLARDNTVWRFQFGTSWTVKTPLTSSVEPTYRELFLSDPPITMLLAQVVKKEPVLPYGSTDGFVVLYDKDGIKLGALQDAAENVASEAETQALECVLVTFGFEVREKYSKVSKFCT